EIPDVADPARWEWLREFVGYAGDRTFAFRHDLVRATAYEGLSFGRRRDIHGRVARALEERAGVRVDEEAGLLSLHFLEAEAFEACEQGLARLEDADEGPERDAVRAALELNAGAINYRQTNNEEAIRRLETAAEYAERANDLSTLAHAYYLLDAAHSDFG